MQSGIEERIRRRILTDGNPVWISIDWNQSDESVPDTLDSEVVLATFQTKGFMYLWKSLWNGPGVLMASQDDENQVSLLLYDIRRKSENVVERSSTTQSLEVRVSDLELRMLAVEHDCLT
jgi:hypothetical protein